MASIAPFRAVQYVDQDGDVSQAIAPPYDVLDASLKAKLLSRYERNVVDIDLPHVPAKELGPPESYQAAADRYQLWLREGTLTRREKPALFAYRQTFTYAGRTHQRCGMACTLPVVPFGPREGGGILPHEETFSGPKADRAALMKATRAQFSPIFGLYADESGKGSTLVRQAMSGREPDLIGRMLDDVAHEVWTIDDAATIDAYTKALAGQDVFIADGHHRYTTAQNHLAQLEAAGSVPADHPARRCMFVLVSMSDPGLVIGPTHRVLGGMKDYTLERFLDAAGNLLSVSEARIDPRRIDQELQMRSEKTPGVNVFALYDFKTGRTFFAQPKADDPLKARFPNKCEAWRKLDVAIIQHAIVEEICQPTLNGGAPITWAFPHSVEDVLEIGRGAQTSSGGGKGFAQLAIIVRSTPLASVRAVSKAGELMPQKSTFFYPKLATGLFMNPLE